MAIKLMYITNKPEIATIAQNAGVDRIFVDLEYIGKEKRQPGDSVKSNHTLDDIKKIRNVIDKSELLVRVNPIHDNSEFEINKAIDHGADILMLPYFKTVKEVDQFLNIVSGRVKTNILVETKEAVENIEQILALKGIDEVHIGLNDLHLSYHLDFMFEPLCNGIVENLCRTFRQYHVSYGFGGFGRLYSGTLPAEKILVEHYRLKSQCSILSRSFYNQEENMDLNTVNLIFKEEIRKIREFERNIHPDMFDKNLKEIKSIVSQIVENAYEYK